MVQSFSVPHYQGQARIACAAGANALTVGLAPLVGWLGDRQGAAWVMMVTSAMMALLGMPLLLAMERDGWGGWRHRPQCTSLLLVGWGDLWREFADVGRGEMSPPPLEPPRSMLLPELLVDLRSSDTSRSTTAPLRPQDAAVEQPEVEIGLFTIAFGILGALEMCHFLQAPSTCRVRRRKQRKEPPEVTMVWGTGGKAYYPR